MGVDRSWQVGVVDDVGKAVAVQMSIYYLKIQQIHNKRGDIRTFSIICLN